MVPCVCLVAAIALTYGALADLLPSQCSNYQTVPGNRDRSRYNNASDSNSALCDNIADGSYRFNSGEISTSCVPVQHCGTVSTIWMRDPIPDVGTTSYNEFCVNHESSSSHGDPCCLFSFRVNVTNCHGFLVYDFRSDDVLCPSGYCTESYPKMQKPPTLTPPILSANGEDFTQTCVIHHNESNAEFKVTWLFGVKEYKTRILTNGTKKDSLNSSDWIGHVGQHLQCQVTSYFRYSQDAPHSPTLHSNVFFGGISLQCQVTSYFRYSQDAPHSPTLHSNVFFGGISVPTSPIRVDEGKQREVTLISTLPVLCKNASVKTCNHDIQISIQGVNPNGLMVTQGCSVQMRSENWDSAHKHMKLNLTLTTGADVMNKPPADYLVKFHVPYDLGHPMWNHYQLPDLQVTTHDIPIRTCLVVGDPHIIGIKIGMASLFYPGDYLIYKAFSFHGNILQVQARLWSPRHQGSSICAVAVQYNEALIMVDMCTTRVNMTAPVITQGEVTPDDLRVYRCGAEYKIMAGDGVRVTIHLHELNMDLKLDLPPSYPQNVEGTCDISAGHKPEANLTLQHALSWNLQSNESFFLEKGRNFYKVKPQGAPTQRFCACRSDSTCDSFARFVDPLCTMAGQHLKCENHCEIVTPHAVNPEYGVYTVEDPSHYGKVNMNWSNSITNTTRLRQICNSKIAGVIPARCRSVAFVLDTFMQICEDDYTASGGFTFADSAVLGAVWVCELIDFAKFEDYHQAPDGSFYVKPNLAIAYCPDHCNGKGKCVYGQCMCVPGYKGEDCSIHADQPPQILGIKGGLRCEMSTLHCLDLILVTRNVDNSDKLTAQIDIVETLLGKPVPKIVSVLLEPRYENKYSVSLPLSNVYKQLHDKTAIAMLIKLSNDGKLFSAPIAYGMYDDKCVYCSTERIECYQKESSCHIDGECFVNGEINPKNASEVCDPDKGLVRWSENIVRPKSTSITSLTASSTTTTGNIVIIG